MDKEKTMTRLADLKETLTYEYQEHANILQPVLKFLLSALTLWILQKIFKFNGTRIDLAYILIVSVIQALVPMGFLYYSACAFVILNLWSISIGIAAGFLALALVCWLFYIRAEREYAFLVVLVPVLYYLKLEYMMPVLLGMLLGYSAFLPVVFGTLVYFFGIYTADASALIITSESADPGLGLQRIVSLMVIDNKMLVLLVSMCLTIFIAAQLNSLFHERAWLFSILISYLAFALILLSGKFIFELDYSIWRIFLEGILGIGLCIVIWFFRGIGDVSRMERVSFEDEDYIYFVKAVPKIKVTKKKREVTRIEAEEETENTRQGQNPEEFPEDDPDQ